MNRFKQARTKKYTIKIIHGKIMLGEREARGRLQSRLLLIGVYVCATHKYKEYTGFEIRQ